MQADDMGLGKTLSIISLVASDLDARPQASSEDEDADELTDAMQAMRLNNLYASCVTPSDEARKPRAVASVSARVNGVGEGEDGGGGDRSGPTLIVCPLSVMHNWQAQIAQHTLPGLLKVVGSLPKLVGCI